MTWRVAWRTWRRRARFWCATWCRTRNMQRSMTASGEWSDSRLEKRRTTQDYFIFPQRHSHNLLLNLEFEKSRNNFDILYKMFLILRIGICLFLIRKEFLFENWKITPDEASARSCWYFICRKATNWWHRSPSWTTCAGGPSSWWSTSRSPAKWMRHSSSTCLTWVLHHFKALFLDKLFSNSTRLFFFQIFHFASLLGLSELETGSILLEIFATDYQTLLRILKYFLKIFLNLCAALF